MEFIDKSLDIFRFIEHLNRKGINIRKKIRRILCIEFLK